MATAAELRVRQLGQVDYARTQTAMREFTLNRNPLTPDELWQVAHAPVFTQGQAGKPEHLLDPGDIPVVQSDRGGQVTYHGPGQVIVYLLLDIRRLGISVRQLVTGIESAVIALLADYDITAQARRDAPGVYVNGSKIAALGLRVRKGCSYHGLSLNVDLDLAPFSRINPCGFAGMAVTRLCDLGVHEPASRVSARLVTQIRTQFGYDG